MAQSTEQAAEISLLLVLLLRQREKVPYALQWWPATVPEAVIEAGVYLFHVLVDDLKREIFFVSEVMIERTFRGARGSEKRLDPQIVVAALQEHRQAGVEEPLFGVVDHLHYWETRPVIMGDPVLQRSVRHLPAAGASSRRYEPTFCSM